MREFLIMDNESFGDWLVKEMKARYWTQADLARKSKLSKQSISQLVNEIRGPGPDAIKALANAFTLDPLYVMQVAGLLPEDPIEQSTISQEIIRLVERIPVQEQEHLLEIVRVYTRRFLDDSKESE